MDNNTYYATGTEQENVKAETIAQYIEAFAENCTTYKEREYTGIRFTMSESDYEKGKSAYGKQFLFDYGKDGIVFLEVYQDDNRNQHLAIEAMVKGEDGANKFVDNINRHVKGVNWSVVENKTFNPVNFDRFRKNRYCNFDNEHKYFSDKFFYISTDRMAVKEKKVSDLCKTGVVLPKNFEVERISNYRESEKNNRWYHSQDNVNAVAGLGALIGGLSAGIYGGYQAGAYVYGATNSALLAAGAGLAAMGVTRKLGAVGGAIALSATAMTLSGIKNTISDAFLSKEQETVLENSHNKMQIKLNKNSLLYQCMHGFRYDTISLKLQDTNDFSVSKVLETDKEGFLISAKLDGEEKFGVRIILKNHANSVSMDNNGNYLINKKDTCFVLEYENGGNQYSKTIDFSKDSSFGFNMTKTRAKSAELAQCVEDVITHDRSCVPDKYRIYIPKENKEIVNEISKFDNTKEENRTLKPKEKTKEAIKSNSNEIEM